MVHCSTNPFNLERFYMFIESAISVVCLYFYFVFTCCRLYFNCLGAPNNERQHEAADTTITNPLIQWKKNELTKSTRRNYQLNTPNYNTMVCSKRVSMVTNSCVSVCVFTCCFCTTLKQSNSLHFLFWQTLFGELCLCAKLQPKRMINGWQNFVVAELIEFVLLM